MLDEIQTVFKIVIVLFSKLALNFGHSFVRASRNSRLAIINFAMRKDYHRFALVVRTFEDQG